MTDFDVWWTDQDCGNLDTKDLCRDQWVTMEKNGLDCSTITKIMGNFWASEFSKRIAAMNELAALGQDFDRSQSGPTKPRNLAEAARVMQKRIGSTPFPGEFQQIADDAHMMIARQMFRIADLEKRMTVFSEETFATPATRLETDMTNPDTSTEAVEKLAENLKDWDEIDEGVINDWRGRASVTVIALAAERDTLHTAIKRQAGAAKTLHEFTLDQVQHLRDVDRTNYIAPSVIQGEREANASLSADNEALRDRLTTVEARVKAADALVGMLQETVAEHDTADYGHDEENPWTMKEWFDEEDREAIKNYIDAGEKP